MENLHSRVNIFFLSDGVRKVLLEVTWILKIGRSEIKHLQLKNFSQSYTKLFAVPGQMIDGKTDNGKLRKISIKKTKVSNSTLLVGDEAVKVQQMF